MESQNSTAYGDISQFKELVSSIDSFSTSIDNIKNYLTPLLDDELYDRLSVDEKLEHDIFIAYAFSSLFWMFQKSLGTNPAGSRVKGEIDRVKEHAKRFKLIKERKTIPHIDKEAAKRFIRSGLWTPGQVDVRKKRKRED